MVEKLIKYYEDPNILVTALSLGGGYTFTSDNTYNDDVDIFLGTDSDASLVWVTTGAGATTEGLWVGVPTASQALYFGQEEDKGYDFLGLAAGGALSGPTIFMFSGDQVKNEHARYAVEGSVRRFAFTTSNGNHLDGTATSDAGVNMDFTGGNGGTDGAGGDGARLRFTAGDGGGTAGNGGEVSFSTGEGSGSGLPGKLSFTQGATVRLENSTDGTINWVMDDNLANAYIIKEGNNEYFHITTTDASEIMYFGNTTTNPDFEFRGTGSVTFGGRILGKKGSDVASATDMTLGDGNFFDITGTTQIDTIVATDWTAGSIITLQFDGSVTVKHNTAGTGASMLLSGAGDFSATADDTLTLIYDGVTWREIARTVI